MLVPSWILGTVSSYVVGNVGTAVGSACYNALQVLWKYYHDRRKEVEEEAENAENKTDNENEI